MKAVVHQEQDRTKAVVVSLIFHAAMLAILIFYRFAAQEPITEAPAIVLDWGGGGDNAAAGLPDEGQGNDPAPQGQQMEDPTSTTPADDPAPSTPSKTSPSTPTPSTSPTAANTPTTDDPNVAALKKQQEEAKKRADDAERQRKAQEAEAQRIADEKRRADEEAARQAQAERDKKKGQFGGSFGKPGSTGTGQGNTGKPGNQGIPGGTGDNPFGKSNGTGGGSGGGDGTGTGASVGGGLGGRTVVQRGRVSDTSQKSGKVVVEVCVDSEGRVVSADYTQRGSTTSDSELRTKAIAAAKGYRFVAAPGSSNQCGTITFNFQLK